MKPGRKAGKKKEKTQGANLHVLMPLKAVLMLLKTVLMPLKAVLMLLKTVLMPLKAVPSLLKTS